MPHLNNKQTNKTTNPVISRQDYHLTQPCPSEEKQIYKTLSTNLTLYKVYTNHWTKLRMEETKTKKEFNLEAMEKKTSNTIRLKKNNEKAEKYCTNEGTNEKHRSPNKLRETRQTT